MQVRQCRICGQKIVRIFSFGNMPIVNYFLGEEELRKTEDKYPLNFCLCENCGLAQLDRAIPAQKLFSTYHYVSSTSLPLKKHLERLADLCRERFRLCKGSTVLDIGCNDGVLLSAFKIHDVQTIGVDPAKNIVEETKKRGIKVIRDFFTFQLAKKMKKKYGQFDAIVATNTIAQIVDLHDFVKGVNHLLSPIGVFIVEVGYLLDTVLKKTFDSIYHEHYCYFSLKPLMLLFNMHNLEIFDAERVGIHGGSLRIYIKHKKDKKRRKTKHLIQMLHNESQTALDRRLSYKNFITYIRIFKKTFRLKLTAIKKMNKSIVGVGAPAKGVILLNFCNINRSFLDYIVDSTPYKQYRYMPGVHVPIYPEEKIGKNSTPDYFLLLAWTYREEIEKKLEKYRKHGSKIIIPFPTLKVI